MPPTARPNLRTGSTGAAVRTVQARLAGLGYFLGKTSGRYDHTTGQAVMALQKAAGLARDGQVGPKTWTALERGVRPQARSRKGHVIEVDLRRQLLLVVDNGTVSLVVNTSTGTSATPTPRGTYRVGWQVGGWRRSSLGYLYKPKYFFRGYAIHGVRDGNIPGRPASHGCARVSMAAMDRLWGQGGIRIGDAVHVY